MKEFNDYSRVDDLIKMSIDKVKILMETNTIIGEAIQVNSTTTIIPISKASVGFVVGGGEYSDHSNRRIANNFPMAGGSGCGMSVTPVGFIVIMQNEVKFVDVENKSMYQTMLNLVNKIISNVNLDKEGKNEEE